MCAERVCMESVAGGLAAFSNIAPYQVDNRSIYTHAEPAVVDILQPRVGSGAV